MLFGPYTNTTVCVKALKVVLYFHLQFSEDFPFSPRGLEGAVPS